MTFNRVCRAFGLQAHRSDTFRLSADAPLIPKVHDIRRLVHADELPDRAFAFAHTAVRAAPNLLVVRPEILTSARIVVF